MWRSQNKIFKINTDQTQLPLPSKLLFDFWLNLFRQSIHCCNGELNLSDQIGWKCFNEHFDIIMLP